MKKRKVVSKTQFRDLKRFCKNNIDSCILCIVHVFSSYILRRNKPAASLNLFNCELVLVEKLGPVDLLESLKTRGQRDPQITEALIRSKLEDKDSDEIATTSCKVHTHSLAGFGSNINLTESKSFLIIFFAVKYPAPDKKICFLIEKVISMILIEVFCLYLDSYINTTKQNFVEKCWWIKNMTTSTGKIHIFKKYPKNKQYIWRTKMY